MTKNDSTQIRSLIHASFYNKKIQKSKNQIKSNQIEIEIEMEIKSSKNNMLDFVKNNRENKK